MNNVVFKIKYNHPNKKSTTKLNVNHFSYICKRPRAIYNNGKNFCCFGKISDLTNNCFSEIGQFVEAKEYIKKKSLEKTTIYKCVISLTEEDALKKGFNNRKAWEDLIKYNANKISKQLGIDSNDFEYVCSVHNESGHPHIHVMAWDRNQEIQKTNVPKEKIFNIRKMLTNYVFKDDLQEIYNYQNKYKGEYKEELENLFKISDEEYKEILKEIKSLDLDMNESKIYNINIKEKFVNDIIKEIYLLKKELPESGRLKYGFMPTNIKRHLDSISKKIIANNLEVRTAFYNYIESVEKLSEFSNNNEKYIKKDTKKAEDELLKFIGNKILAMTKNLNEMERTEEQNTKNQFQKSQILYVLKSLMDYMVKNENKNRNIYKNYVKGESLEYRKEMRQKLRDKSLINWEVF